MLKSKINKTENLKSRFLSGKNQKTKKLFTFMLLISGMFSFSFATAQCTCTNNQSGFCFVNSHGVLKCHRNHGGIFRTSVKGTEITSDETSSTNVFPNPVSNTANISFYLEQSQKVALQIFDLSGRLVSTLDDKIFKQGENELAWSTENVNSGVYFLQLQSAENQEQIKLVVSK